MKPNKQWDCVCGRTDVETFAFCKDCQPNEQAVYEWRYDFTTKVGYLKLSEEKVAKTIELADGRVMMDKGENGEIIGVEILL